MDDYCPSDTVNMRYQQARASLELAQSERTEAVCRYMEVKAEWIEANRDQSYNELLRPIQKDDPFSQAERELQRAERIYCAAVEQHQLLLRILEEARIAFKHAQDNLERLAIEHSHS